MHATYTQSRGRPWTGRSKFMRTATTCATVANLEHDRMYSFATMLAPNPRLAIGFGYNYWDVYTQAEICFNYSISYTNPPPATGTFSHLASRRDYHACPIAGASVGAAGVGTLSTYASNDHFAHADLIWKPTKRVTAAARIRRQLCAREHDIP